MWAAALVWNIIIFAEGFLAVLNAVGCANTFAIIFTTFSCYWSLEAGPPPYPDWWWRQRAPAAGRADTCTHATNVNPVQIKQIFNNNYSAQLLTDTVLLNVIK